MNTSSRVNTKDSPENEAISLLAQARPALVYMAEMARTSFCGRCDVCNKDIFCKEDHADNCQAQLACDAMLKIDALLGKAKAAEMNALSDLPLVDSDFLSERDEVTQERDSLD